MRCATVTCISLGCGPLASRLARRLCGTTEVVPFYKTLGRVKAHHSMNTLACLHEMSVS